MTTPAGAPVPRWQLERRAFDALSTLYAHAETVRELFEAAGLETPEPLTRFFGDAAADDESDEPLRMTVPPFRAPVTLPHMSEPDWIWVPVAALSPRTLVIGKLRDYWPNPIPGKLLANQMKDEGFTGPHNSIYNIGAKLEEHGLIVRTDAGWVLKEESMPMVPHLADGYAWGPPKVFLAPEIAAFRRGIITHLLSVAPDGLQTVQVVKFLRESTEYTERGLGVPSKDVIEDDLMALEKARAVRRNMRSKKWEVV
jgi:hypothetical protein